MAALTKHYGVRSGVFGRTLAQVHAVDEVSFAIAEGETLGLVGESGCGKSTLGKAVLRLTEPTAGTIRWRGQRIDQLKGRAMRPYRREMQAVFQDPYASLNPRMRAADIVAEPIRNFEQDTPPQVRERVLSLFERVGLRADQMPKYPYEFSGGQRQRLGIARALAPRPKLIVCDEPVSALDVSVQAQVINLLVDLQREFGLSYLFVAHDLAVVEHISHRVAVMYLGRIVEVDVDARAVRQSAASLHRSVARGGPGAQPCRPAKAHHSCRRCAQSDQASHRLPLPHALSVCVRSLPSRGAGVEGSHACAPGRVPPARSADRGRERRAARKQSAPNGSAQHG